MRFNLDHATDILSRTPAILKSMLGDIPAEWAFGNEGNQTWSPFDVIGHLIHGERTDWIARARIILEDGESKTFEPFDRFAQLEASKGKSLEELLSAFAELRTRNIETLKSMKLKAEDMQRKGRHPELGVVTLEELIASWVAHDLDHIAQVSRTLAKQYKETVGPWAAYLSILK